MARVKKQKTVLVSLEDQYQQVGREFFDYIDSFNLSTITNKTVRAVLALELDIVDERMIEPIRLLVERFTTETDIPILPVLRVVSAEG